LVALTPPAFPAAIAPAPIPPTAAARPPHPFSAPLPISAVAQRGGVDEWPQRKSRVPLIIGIVVAVAAIGGGVFFVMNSSSPAAPPAAPISALPGTAPTTAHTSAEPNATATADTSPTTDSTATGSRSAMDPPSATPQTTPNAGFAELFANGARRADEQHGATQRFDATAAKAALTTAAAGTAPCREKGGPAGKATIVVTFEPSGKVATAVVSDAPFAGTSSGACISAAMKRATVPPFSGLPGTVTKVISIQ
jgi:cytoskeletal protein RodZ